MRGLSSSLGLTNSLSSYRTAKFKGHSDAESIALDGTNDYITMGAVNNLSDADFSISVWFKRASLTSADGLIMKRQDTDNVWFLQVTSAEKIFFQASTSRTVRIKYLTNVESTLNNTDWHHIVVTVDRSDASVSRIWLDGTAITSYDTETETGITEDIDNTGDFIIGQGAAAGGSYFHGNIADVSIWNTAFTPTSALAITDLRDGSSGAGNAIPADIKGYSGLVSWYRMGDGVYTDGNVTGNGLIADSLNATIGSELLADGNMQAAGITSWDEHAVGDYEVPFANLSKDTTIYRSGSQSLRINCETYPEAGVLAKITSMSTSTLYKWTGWFRADSDVAGGNGVTITGDYDGGLAGDMDISLGTFKTASGNLTADTWTQFTHYFIPTGTTVYFGCWIRTAGIVHLDDWSVKAVNGKPGIMTNMTASDIELGSVVKY